MREVIYCPVCGAENPDKVIKEAGGGILGCDECLCIYDAWEYFEEADDA
jgi:uncharacterized Zn finger protein